ncbi:MAG: hypothetical protein QF415_17500 [Candidatus Undinarchaeales archaeon]|nr:hypothetical protein [Candidatus Undinarchaeales archaeon]MDP7493796.1 hypothetical protein [Candidatus Undinarchaeales archaeon]
MDLVLHGAFEFTGRCSGTRDYGESVLTWNAKLYRSFTIDLSVRPGTIA